MNRCYLTTGEPTTVDEIRVDPDVFDRLNVHQWYRERTTGDDLIFTWGNAGRGYLASAVTLLRNGGRLG